ncbi:MAG: histone deacetylase family protein [Alphaproteobacteria bacterium]|nr:histone deacetylase family protein [Alphaproteobacteria bacterium]
MSTLLITHEACLNHDTGPGHPESPARLAAVLRRLRTMEFAGLEERPAREATVDELARVHPRAYVEALLDGLPTRGMMQLDADTIVSAGSKEAALRAAGAVVQAVDAVMAGEARNAFCAVRPPGHHAEPASSMGFCLFNNVAVGALHAKEVHGMKRVAVIDFDVHHGNGTQAAFWDEPDLFFASTHQYPHYPNTGARNETGQGNIVNVPMRAGSGSPEFRHAMSELVLPALADFSPDFVLISAGFDAHADDPLSSIDLHELDYAWATKEILRIARYACEGRVVSTLEGGYDLVSLAESSAAHVRALMGLSS